MPLGQTARLLCLSVILSLALASAATAQVTDSKQVGGPGGGPFEDTCHAGDLLVGFNYTAGKALNTVAPVCQPVDQQGRLTGAVYGLNTWGHAAEGTSSYASSGAVRCPDGEAVEGLHVWVDKFGEVHHVRTNCYPLAGGQPAYLRATDNSGGQPSSDASLSCPPGSFAIGMTGGYGALIDRLGLKCQARSFGAAANTSAPPALPPQPAPSDVRGTTADFAGVWETVLPQTGSHYRLTLVVSGNTVTGTFINEENSQFNGTLTGTVNGARLDYTYTEPQAGVSGGGYFIVSAGQTLSGFTHSDSSKTQYGWEGHRVQ